MPAWRLALHAPCDLRHTGFSSAPTRSPRHVFGPLPRCAHSSCIIASCIVCVRQAICPSPDHQLSRMGARACICAGAWRPCRGGVPICLHLSCSSLEPLLGCSWAAVMPRLLAARPACLMTLISSQGMSGGKVCAYKLTASAHALRLSRLRSYVRLRGHCVLHALIMVASGGSAVCWGMILP